MTQIKLNPVEFPAAHVWKHYRKAVNDKILSHIVTEGLNPVEIELIVWNKIFLPWIDQDNFNHPAKSKAQIERVQNAKIYLPDGGPWFAGQLECSVTVTRILPLFQESHKFKGRIKSINLTIYHSPECTIGVLQPWHLRNNVFCLEKKTEKGFETMLVRLKMGGWI